MVAEVIWLKTKKEDWLKIARTIAKGFIIVFAVGAATGTASEFGLVLLWLLVDISISLCMLRFLPF